MNKKQANEIIVSLSNPKKMPCKGYSIPAVNCITGSKLRKIPGSVCYDCYACKGCYQFSNVKATLEKRFETTTKATIDREHGQRWITAMTAAIGKSEFFRWHDSGDLQSVDHLLNIVEVAKNSPNTRHWLPTKEKKILNAFFRAGHSLPENMIVRLSGYFVDGEAPKFAASTEVKTSTVHDQRAPIGHACPAENQNGECRDCRACWSKDVSNVSYHKH